MFIHGVKFNISRSFWGLQKAGEWLRQNEKTPRLPDESWYFDKVVSESGFKPLDFSDEVKNSILELAKGEKLRIRDQLGDIIIYQELLSAFLSSINVDFFSLKGVYLHKDPFAIVLRIDEDSFIVISKNREEGKIVVDKFNSRFIELGKTIENFGYLIDRFQTGKDIVKQWLESKKEIFAINKLEPKTDLEKKVIEIIDQFTDSYLSNLEIIFKDPSESFEYDLVLVLHEKLALNIEVMDYEKVKDEIQKLKETTTYFKENLKSTILLRTFDKTNRLGIESVIILNGFPEDVFSNIQEIATSRGIILLDGKSINNIASILISKLSALARTPIPSFDDFIGEYRKRIELFR